MDALPCVRRCSWWVPAVRGRIVFFARTHFLVCEDVAGGSQQLGGKRFFREIRLPVRWVPAVRWRNHYFARNKEAFPCVRPWTRLSASPCTVHFRCMSVVDHVDLAAPRAPGRWTTARPRKGTTRRQGRLGRCFCFPRGGEYDCTRVY